MRRFLWPMASLALITAPLAAQDNGAPLTINLGGTASVPVEASTPTGRMALGRATPGTPFTVLASALNVGKGKRVTLTKDQTGSEPKVVITVGDQADRVCEDARRDRDDACIGIVAFEMPDKASISLDASLNRANVTDLLSGLDINKLLVPTPPRLTGYGSGMDDFRRRSIVKSWSATFGVATNKFVNLDKTACGGATGCSVDATSLGLIFGLQKNLTPHLGLQAQYVRATNTVRRAGGQEQKTTVSSYQLGAVFRLGGGGGITSWLGGGAGYWQNNGDVFVNGSLITNRSQGGVRTFVRGGLDIPFSPRFSLKTGLTYAGFKSGDADAMMSGEVAIAINL